MDVVIAWALSPSASNWITHRAFRNENPSTLTNL
jgi:hypothetical protein